MRIVWSFSPKNEMVYRLVDIHFHGLACSGHAIHPSQRSRVLTSAPITLEENVWLGANVTVVGGVTIGSGSVIGAGSVVTKDIPAGVIAAGVPCKIIREITDDDLFEDMN